jgi:hypothetical protein
MTRPLWNCLQFVWRGRFAPTGSTPTVSAAFKNAVRGVYHSYRGSGSRAI